MKLWTLRKSFRFEASHQLMFHDGKCARLHGHSWKLTVEVGGYKLQNSVEYEGEGHNPKLNMVMDYSDISAVVKPLVESHLDHWHLNDTFGSEMPTSEYIAEEIFRFLKPRLPALRAVEIDETCTSACRFENVEDSQFPIPYRPVI